jgi:hypothetical protein
MKELNFGLGFFLGAMVSMVFWPIAFLWVMGAI